jgi:hypothetical protein
VAGAVQQGSHDLDGFAEAADSNGWGRELDGVGGQRGVGPHGGKKCLGPRVVGVSRAEQRQTRNTVAPCRRTMASNVAWP